MPVRSTSLAAALLLVAASTASAAPPAPGNEGPAPATDASHSAAIREVLPLTPDMVRDLARRIDQGPGTDSKIEYRLPSGAVLTSAESGDDTAAPRASLDAMPSGAVMRQIALQLAISNRITAQNLELHRLQSSLLGALAGQRTQHVADTAAQAPVVVPGEGERPPYALLLLVVDGRGGISQAALPLLYPDRPACDLAGQQWALEVRLAHVPLKGATPLCIPQAADLSAIAARPRPTSAEAQ